MRLTWPSDFVNKIICGDCLEVMKEMPDGSVDMVITSPPYWGLRDYGNKQIFGGDKDCEHEWSNSQIEHDALRYRGHNANVGSNRNPEIHLGKEGSGGNHCSCGAWKGQLGLEPTPEMYIEHLTEIFNEAKRVLKKEGTLWLNIGDTYLAQQGKGFPGTGQVNIPDRDKNAALNIKRPKNIPPKCLCMIPERLAWSLIQNGWILRNKIIWYKPNAMPSSVTDRFSNRWEYLFMFSKSQRYYFNLDAVREAHQYPIDVARRMRQDKMEEVEPFKKGSSICRHTKIPEQQAESFGSPRARYNRKGDEDLNTVNPLGKNPGDVFEINTQPFPEAHFAVFPEKLCEKPIKAGCPEEVCKKCGKARERIVETINPRPDGGTRNVGDRKDGYTTKLPANPYAEKREVGWTSCNCNAGFEGGIVLDPFCGAGTALYVAKEMKRNYIGIDIKQEYCDICEKRLAQGVI